MLRITILLFPVMIGMTSAVADDDQLNHIKQQLVDGIYEARGKDRRAEEALVAQGISMQDAEQRVRGFLDGIVGCLLDGADAERLSSIEELFEESNVEGALRVMAVDDTGDDCLLNEMQQAGITMNLLEKVEADAPTEVEADDAD